MNKQEFLEMLEKVKIREGLLKNVEHAQAVLSNAQMNLSVEMHRAAGARFKTCQLKEKLAKQKRPITQKQIGELIAWQELSKIETDKEIDLCFAENDLVKAKEELEIFEQEELLSCYEVVDKTEEEHSSEITPIEEMVKEADWNEEKKIVSIKKSFETFFID